MNNRIIFPRAWKHFLGLKDLNSLMRIRDPGWKKHRSRIRNPGFNRLAFRNLVEEKAASGQATAHRLHTVSSTTIASLGTILSHQSSGHLRPVIQAVLDKSQKESHNSRNQGFSGSGSIPLTIGSGSDFFLQDAKKLRNFVRIFYL